MNKHIRTLIAGSALLVVAFGASGAAAQTALEPQDRTFFLRGKGCGATEEFWLATQAGTDEYDGCGIVGGIPGAELFRQLGVPIVKTFPAVEGLPVVLDASKNATGSIRAESWFGNAVPGVGQVAVEVALSGVDSANQQVQIGSASVQVLNTGSGGVQANFSVDIPDALDRVELKELTLDVEIHGANWNSGNLGLEGDSKLVLPILAAAAE